MRHDKILIIGVTCTGKGQLAFELARDIGAEIISVDSMKVYRRMDIGTAKPPMEARQQVRYHLIDVVEPSESFNVAAFLKMAEEAVRQIRASNKPVIAVGGTALYIKALLYGLFEGPGTNPEVRNQLRKDAQKQGLESLYGRLQQVDPKAAENIHPNDAKRIIRALEVYQTTGTPISTLQRQWSTGEPRYNWYVIGLRRDRTDTSRRINRRVRKMIEAGLVEEVESLLAEDKPLSEQARCAIGYAEIIEHLQGGVSLDAAIERIKKNTRRLAKNQRTWFKTFRNVNWLDIEPDEAPENILRRVRSLLNNG